MLLALPAFAANIYVPSGAITTIQGGIDAASSGDTVIVRIGVYPGGINFKGKLITVRSENGPQTCTIDGGGNTRGVTFAGGETAQAASFGKVLWQSLIARQDLWLRRPMFDGACHRKRPHPISRRH